MVTVRKHFGILSLAILGLSLAMSSTAMAQNFAPNPSFETATGCVTGNGWTNVGSWYVVVNHSGSPDRFHVCAPGTFGVPSNVFGDQLARTGSSYVGFVTNFGTGNTFREYLQAPLTATLTPGTSYTVSAYMSLSDGSGWATDGMGFYFSNTAVTGTGSSDELPFVPQVSNPPGNYINSKVNWMLVTGNFVATPGLQYITFGNFKPNATTGVQVQASGWSWNYSYLDDISVVPAVILSAEMGPIAGEVGNDAAQISWQTFSEIGSKEFIVERSLDDLSHFAAIGSLEAKGLNSGTTDYQFTDQNFDPHKLNYYRIKEVDQNGEGGYSETILLYSQELDNQVQLHVYPNPIISGAALTMQLLSSKTQSLQARLVDINGRIVFESTLDLDQGDNQISLQIPALASGCYFLTANGNGVQLREKILVRGQQ